MLIPRPAIVYDFSAYSFSIYSTQWISVILGEDTSLWKSFGWGTLVNAFYLPGAIAGAYISDWIGPRRALYTFVFLQGCVGFLMAGLYGILGKPANIAGFVVIYGWVFSWLPLDAVAPSMFLQRLQLTGA